MNGSHEKVWKRLRKRGALRYVGGLLIAGRRGGPVCRCRVCASGVASVRSGFVRYESERQEGSHHGSKDKGYKCGPQGRHSYVSFVHDILSLNLIVREEGERRGEPHGNDR